MVRSDRIVRVDPIAASRAVRDRPSQGDERPALAVMLGAEASLLARTASSVAATLTYPASRTMQLNESAAIEATSTRH